MSESNVTHKQTLSTSPTSDSRPAFSMKRFLMCAFGTTFTGFSVGIFSFSKLGMDPFQVFTHGIWYQLPLTFGMTFTIFCAILLIIIFFVNRKLVGIGTVFSTIITGYAADFAVFLLSRFITPDTLPVKLILLIIAIPAICFASSMYYTANLGVSPYDAVALTLAERTPVPFKYCRIGCDLICFIIGVLLCLRADPSFATDSILMTTTGIGTLITAFFMGPLIAFFNTHIAEPFLNK